MSEAPVYDPPVKSKPRYRTEGQIMRRVITVEEYYAMAELGILKEDERTELIDGEIHIMSPPGSEHASMTNKLNRGFTRHLDPEMFIVSVQNPLYLNDENEPQPDIAILKYRKDEYSKKHPTAADALLVIEVSKSSHRTDRDIKVPLYARFRIPEVWIVDLQKKCIEIHTKPGDQGYDEVRRYKAGEEVASASLPDFKLAVGELFG